MLSLKGEWFKCRVTSNSRGRGLWTEKEAQPIMGGMSGSPIVLPDGGLSAWCASPSRARGSVGPTRCYHQLERRTSNLARAEHGRCSNGSTLVQALGSGPSLRDRECPQRDRHHRCARACLPSAPSACVCKPNPTKRHESPRRALSLATSCPERALMTRTTKTNGSKKLSEF